MSISSSAWHVLFIFIFLFTPLLLLQVDWLLQKPCWDVCLIPLKNITCSYDFIHPQYNEINSCIIIMKLFLSGYNHPIKIYNCSITSLGASPSPHVLSYSCLKALWDNPHTQSVNKRVEVTLPVSFSPFFRQAISLSVPLSVFVTDCWCQVLTSGLCGLMPAVSAYLIVSQADHTHR